MKLGDFVMSVAAFEAATILRHEAGEPLFDPNEPHDLAYWIREFVAYNCVIDFEELVDR